MYVDRLDFIKKRFAEFWNKENHDRPIMSITAPKPGVAPIQPPLRLNHRDNWWDTELVIKRGRANMEATAYLGEAFPMLCPNLGPDVFAAFMGAELEYSPHTSWAKHFVENWEDHHFSFDPNNPYWKKIVEMTEAMLDDAKGDYLVGVTDLHQGFDALVALRGPENVCMDLYDQPEAIREKLTEIETAFKEVLYRSYDMILAKQQGVVNWMWIYHPDKWYVSSSDFTYMVSPETFDDFCGESIRREAELIGPCMYHMDGVGQLNHVDKLLAMKEINGIQWVYGDGKPTAAHWIDLLKKIQSAGKLIQVSCVPEDMPALLSSGLRPEGVHYTIKCGSVEQAQKILSDAEEAYKGFRR